MDLSVLIPARQEVYLQRTIQDVLANSEAGTEVIATCDGYWPDPPIQDHPRVTLIHHTEALGQRQSINQAARIARGQYLMKLDAHCAVGPGFDRICLEAYRSGEVGPGDTTVPRMYNLDVETWTPKLRKRTDYMYIGCAEERLLRPEYYSRQPDTDKEIDETMCCMGPGWILSAEQFWKQDGCDEAHGSWGQQGVEVACKAWLSGNRLVVNKRTWFAHWFRGGGGPGFPYRITGHEVEAARKYSRSLWLDNKWPGQTRTFQWLVDKFQPPGWENMVDRDKVAEINGFLYSNLHRRNHEPYWRGVHCVKMPEDLILYHMAIWQSRPEVIVEIGTRYGGSSLFLQDQLDLLGQGGKVVTVDIRNIVKQPDPRITYLHGDSRSDEIIAQVRQMTEGKRTMVILDGDHRRAHVKWELHHYSPMVTAGQYLVVEDCYVRDLRLFGPGEARDWFLATRPGRQFEQTNLDREFLVGLNVGGWLRRK